MLKSIGYYKSILILIIFLLAPESQGSVPQSCPVDPPPVDCDVTDQFTSGRIAFNQLNGSYEISGTEEYIYDEDYDWLISDEFETSGTLQVELVDGADANYLDINCDGTVTGQGKDKISGIINKTYIDSEICPNGTMLEIPPNEMDWNIEINRTYSITGMVTNTGELELELSIDTADLSILNDSTFIDNPDCLWWEGTAVLNNLDISGDTVNIKLLDSNYDPNTSSQWSPEYSILDDKSWLENIGHRLLINASYNFDETFVFNNPALVTIENLPGPYGYHEYNALFFQDTVTASLTADYQADPKTPVITDLVLEEEKHYLLDVDVNTDVTVTVDWKESDTAHQIEFTYGSTTETVAATGNETTWSFNAGDAGTSIKAKAISQSGDSQEWEINTNKVAVPAWAGTSSDWSGSSGIQYEATLDWPVSLETTQTVDTLSLMTGLWGVSGSISSEFNAKANSNGSPGNASLTTNANLNLAGKNFSFDLNGSNTTTLSCDALTTYGDATAQFSGLNWQKTMNPVTAIPGLAPAVCGLSGALCNLINSFGIKGEADAILSGDGTFMDDGSEIKWDTGHVGGSLSAQISVNAIPKALRSVASIGVEGGGTGCIEFEFTPDFNMSMLGGEVNVGANVSFFGLGVNPSQDWPFGDGCTARSIQTVQGNQAWVPADGQLAMAISPSYSAAVWSELPIGQNRPSGDIKLRIWDGNQWGSIIELTNDADADMAPSVEFDQSGHLVIVYQRSTATLPTMSNELDAFANELELNYVVYDPVLQTVENTGHITTNNTNDFGPTIKTDQNNNLHLFWQRANGTHIFGDDVNTVSLHSSSWDHNNQTWSNEETVADHLSFTLGWSAASYSDNKMLVTLLVDTDDNFVTSDDRELFHISKINGAWDNPVQITNNLINDDAPLAAFNHSGDPVILWRQAAQVLQLEGDLSAAPVVAFTSVNPDLDDGIGSEFGDGLILKSNLGLATFWQNSTKIQITSHIEQNDWIDLGQVGPLDGAHHLLDGKLIGTQAFVGYAERLFENNNTNLSEFMTPKIQVVNLISDDIFSDGFEVD